MNDRALISKGFSTVKGDIFYCLNTGDITADVQLLLAN